MPSIISVMILAQPHSIMIAISKNVFNARTLPLHVHQLLVE